jgi:hypothetical protein
MPEFSRRNFLATVPTPIEHFSTDLICAAVAERMLATENLTAIGVPSRGDSAKAYRHDRYCF